jgi:predicted metal-binding protein
LGKKADFDEDSLVRIVRDSGATSAKIIPSKDIVVDRRVRLKCFVPICDNFGRHLLCPPNLISVDEFQSVLSLYKRALLIQLESESDSTDKSKKLLGKLLLEEMKDKTSNDKCELRLHEIVNMAEAAAFKKGCYLAAGFIGSECLLCKDCVSQRGNQQCRHPFEARPSMQAMGIDVIRTCENAGMPVRLSSTEKVRWTGLVLLD